MAGPGATAPPPVTFLSDYGLDDEFVGIVHRVVAGVAPTARVVDLTHRLPPHDVRAGALTLWRSVPWLVPGVVLAVVDPGVGTSRRGVVVTVAGAGAHFVGPDNGLLVPAARAAGAISGAVVLDSAAVAAAAGTPDPGAAGLGATFDGRDLFAPAAALLACGCDPRRLGRPVEPETLAGEALSVPRRAEGALHAHVVWVDRFGNAQLDARPADLAALGPGAAAEVAVSFASAAAAGVAAGPGRSGRRTARRVAGYGELRPGELGLVTDSYGMLALSLDRRPAARLLGIAPGDEVVLEPAPQPP